MNVKQRLSTASIKNRQPMAAGFSMKERLNYDEKQESNIPVR